MPQRQLVRSIFILGVSILTVGAKAKVDRGRLLNIKSVAVVSFQVPASFTHDSAAEDQITLLKGLMTRKGAPFEVIAEEVTNHVAAAFVQRLSALGVFDVMAHETVTENPVIREMVAAMAPREDWTSKAYWVDVDKKRTEGPIWLDILNATGGDCKPQGLTYLNPLDPGGGSGRGCGLAHRRSGRRRHHGGGSGPPLRKIHPDTLSPRGWSGMQKLTGIARVQIYDASGPAAWETSVTEWSKKGTSDVHDVLNLVKPGLPGSSSANLGSTSLKG